MRRRDVILGGLAAPLLAGWGRQAVFNGTIRMIGPGQTYATIAAAHAAAVAGDLLRCVATTPKEPITLTKAVWLDFRDCVGANKWDFTGFPSSSLAGGGKGVIEVFTTGNTRVSPGEITGAGMDLTSGDKTSAIRITNNGPVFIDGGNLHDNQTGLASDDGVPASITAYGTVLTGNGLRTNTGSLTHNAYFGESESVTLIGVNSTQPYEAHAIKCRARNFRAIGGLYESLHGACLDLPEGGLFTIDGLTFQKLVTADSSNFLNYATENTNQGFMTNNTIKNSVLDLRIASAIHTIGGTITFTTGNTKTGASPTFFGGGTVVNIP